MQNETDSQTCLASEGFAVSRVRAETLAHLKRMASMGLQAWKVYAWHRAKELSAHPSGIWAGIDDELKTEMTK